METKNKIALITGGSRGLGKNMALCLAAKGTDVIITYNSKEAEAFAVVKEIENTGRKAAALQLNVGDTKSFDLFFTRFAAVLKDTFATEKFDFLINNAGILISSPIATMTEDDFDTLVNIHFKGLYFLTQKALPYLQNGGRIINLSSSVTKFSSPGISVYTAVKGAVELLTVSMAKELGARGIAVNTIALGATATDFGGGIMVDNPKADAYIAGITALGRIGQPDDIGGVVAFLCSEDAKWINAQRIEVSGGMHV